MALQAPAAAACCRVAGPSPAAAAASNLQPPATAGVWRSARRLPAATRSARRPPALAPAATAAQESWRRSSARPSSTHLSDPAKLEGSTTATVAVQERGGELSLDTYMRLPTDQYDELDPSMITSLGGSRFLLRVPRVSLFAVWVEPEVTVQVRLAEDGGGVPGIIFESGECRLKGSELVQRLQLDRRFVLYFHTAMTWHSSNGSSGSGSNGNGSLAAAPAAVPAAASTAATAPAAARAAAPQASITAKTDVQVWCETVGPFAAIPRSVVQATGNAVLGALMQALLPLFLGKLAEDYERWATDAAYRARRAATPAGTQPVAQQQRQQRPAPLR